ncbi:MAG: hypothetical protein AAF245_12725 [Pseudomonadota bacterium]
MTRRKTPPDVAGLHAAISLKLSDLGDGSPYAADANEPDPRYRGYGVRAPEMKRFISSLKPEISPLSTDEKIDLATRLIRSGYASGALEGIGKTIAMSLHERAVLAGDASIGFHIAAALFHRLTGDGIWRAMVPIWTERTTSGAKRSPASLIPTNTTFAAA